MEFAINMTSPEINVSLKRGNLRGEPRWERQACEALLTAGHTVYNMTPGGRWLPPETKHPNYHTSIPAGKEKDLVGIAHDFQPGSVKLGYRAQIFNIFSTHYFRDMPEKVQEYLRHYGNKLIFTQGYYLSDNGNLIKAAVGTDNYEYLGVPGMPEVVMTDNFDKKRIVWQNRGVHLSAFPEKEFPYLEGTIDWVLQRMLADPALEFHILSGLSQKDMEWQGWYYDGSNLFGQGPMANKRVCTVKERIFESKIMQKLLPVQERVIVPEDLGWDGVLDTLKEAKISISVTNERWGGPPCEAGGHGLAFIQPAPESMYAGLNGVIHASNEDIKTRLKIYNRLMDDHAYYREKGDLYRNFIQEHHTYAAFNTNLLRILEARGIN